MKRLAQLVILVAVFFAGYSYGGSSATQRIASVPAAVVEQSDNAAKTVSVMLDLGNGTIKTVSTLPWKEQLTVFQALKAMTEQEKIPLEFKDYGGELGVFVEAIDGIKSDMKAGKWWQFWVNNVYATKGASSVKLEPGDVVMWKFVKGQAMSS